MSRVVESLEKSLESVEAILARIRSQTPPPRDLEELANVVKGLIMNLRREFLESGVPTAPGDVKVKSDFDPRKGK